MRDESSAARVEVGVVVAGRYRVEGILGEGGMGTVYAVTDTASGAARAMKVVADPQPSRVARFFREGRVTMTVASDHVVRVLDIGSIDEKLPYMVMERLEGVTLKRLVELGPLPERTAADLMIQACDGLARAHASGVIHRDVKPSNLFVLTGEPFQLKVLDFGISRMASLVDWERTASATDSGALLGSPQYSAPEQLRDPSSVDERADVWSLGTTLYYALSARVPFEGRSLADLLVAVMSHPPVELSSRVTVSPEMARVVARCLERPLDRRFRSMRDVALALAPLASPAYAALASELPGAAVPLPAAVRARADELHDPRQGRAPDDRTLTVDDSPARLEPVIQTTRTEPPAVVAPSPPAAKRGRVTALLAFVAVVGVVGAGAAALRLRRTAFATESPVLPAVPVSGPSEPSATSAPSEVPPRGVVEAPPLAGSATPELVLVAAAPITRVLRPPSRRISLEDGKAIVSVAPFTGELAIEVEVEGGDRARGTAREGGPTKIQLVTVPRTRSRTRPSPRSTSPSATGDLEKSPYR